MTRRARIAVIILICIGLAVCACGIEGGDRNGCDVNNTCSITTNVGV